MTQNNVISWNKIIAVCSAFGIPAISVACWLIISGTQLVDKVNSIGTKQDTQGIDIKDMHSDIRNINVRLDSLATRQNANKVDIDHKFELQRLRSGVRTGYVTAQRTVTGLVWKPYKP